MGVSENSGTPKSSILIGFSIINHPFWGTTIFGTTQIGIPPWNFDSLFLKRRNGEDHDSQSVSTLRIHRTYVLHLPYVWDTGEDVWLKIWHMQNIFGGHTNKFTKI